jgi:hypothetical protein
MKKALLASVAAVAFVSMTGATAWAQAGGNSIPKYSGGTTVSTNKKVTNHSVGGNSMPSYPKAEHMTKNNKATNHSVGGNTMMSYPKSGAH